MKDYLAPLIPGSIFHIYSRANGSEKLFSNTESYNYFLRQYQLHISPVTTTFCYCLLSNHFHFLIQCKAENIIETHFRDYCKNVKTLEEFEMLSGIKKEHFLANYISRKFSSWLNGYTQAYNNQEKRRGSLFMRHFKRIAINDEKHLRNVIQYIHHNPIKAGLCQHPDKWEHSSYSIITSLQEERSFINRTMVIECFEDLDNFIYCHNQHNPDRVLHPLHHNTCLQT